MTGLQIQQLSPSQLQNLLHKINNCTLLDVRETWEYELARLNNAVLIPLPSLLDNLNQLDKDSSIVCICHHGIRSYNAAIILFNHGFKSVYNLQGGIDAWSLEIDPAIARY